MTTVANGPLYFGAGPIAQYHQQKPSKLQPAVISTGRSRILVPFEVPVREPAAHRLFSTG